MERIVLSGITAADYSTVLGRPVDRRGNTFVWQCPFHSDGAEEEHWSAVGKANGRWTCFSVNCPEREVPRSIIDLAVWNAGQAMTMPKQKAESFEQRKAYAIARERYAGKRIAPGHTAYDAEPPTRSFTELERRFLAEVLHYGHESLKRDQLAQQYLASRGCRIFPIFATISHHKTWEKLRQVATDLGNPNLPLSTGLESTKYPGRSAVYDMVLIFDVGPDGLPTYYQGRAFTTRRKFTYSNPRKIKKHPIRYGSAGPVLGGEGFFKTGWLSSYLQWSTYTLLDAQPEQWGTEELKPLDFWVRDNDAGAGQLASERVLMVSELSDLGLRGVLCPPQGWKDLDGWAKEIGYKRAAYIVEQVVSRHL